MTAFLRELFGLTIYQPARAAAVLKGLSLSREAGWMVLALGVILNTLVYFLSSTLFPMPAEFSLPLLRSPVLVMAFLASVVVVFVFAFYWLGRALGGSGGFDDVLVMMGWLQFMRLAVQLVSLLLMLFLPGLASLFVLAAGLYGGWVVINFLNVVHGFNSLGKAVLMLIFTLIGLTLGLSMFLSVLGVTAIGIS